MTHPMYETRAVAADLMTAEVEYQSLARDEFAVASLVELGTFVSGLLSRYVRCEPAVDRTFGEFVVERVVSHSDVALPASDCVAHSHATILAKVSHKRDLEPAKTLSVSRFHHQLQSYCRMS